MGTKETEVEAFAVPLHHCGCSTLVTDLNTLLPVKSGSELTDMMAIQVEYVEES